MPSTQTSLLPKLVALLLALAAGVNSDDYPGTDRGLRPQILEARDRTHYYQLADNSVGTVVFFHGCARSARNFFPYHEELCPNCIGFPEHVSHTKQALSHGYNVLALEPNDERVLCWSSSERGAYSNDQPDVIAIVKRFLVEHGLTNKPLFLWGASSGGTLALKLPAALKAKREAAVDGEYVFKVDGIISEVATPTNYASDRSGGLAVPDFPPTVFIGMQRDGSAQDAADNINFLRSNNVPAAQWKSPLRQIGPDYLSDRSSTITPYQSNLIVGGLRQIGMLSNEGWLLADPHDFDNPKSTRAFGWTKKLEDLLPWMKPTSKTVSLVLRFSPIQQSLNVAYGRHEAVSDVFTACLKWLEQGGQADFGSLVDRYRVPNGRLAALTADRIGPVVPDDPPTPNNTPQQEPGTGDSGGGGNDDEKDLSWEDEDAVAASSGAQKERKPAKTSWSFSWRR